MLEQEASVNQVEGSRGRRVGHDVVVLNRDRVARQLLDKAGVHVGYHQAAAVLSKPGGDRSRACADLPARGVRSEPEGLDVAEGPRIPLGFHAGEPGALLGECLIVDIPTHDRRSYPG